MTIESGFLKIQKIGKQVYTKFKLILFFTLAFCNCWRRADKKHYQFYIQIIWVMDVQKVEKSNENKWPVKATHQKNVAESRYTGNGWYWWQAHGWTPSRTRGLSRLEVWLCGIGMASGWPLGKQIQNDYNYIVHSLKTDDYLIHLFKNLQTENGRALPHICINACECTYIHTQRKTIIKNRKEEIKTKQKCQQKIT